MGLEEPELTVHPGAIEMVLDFIRQASTQCKVILTTHSPVLLDYVKADEVRVVERVDGETTVSAMAQEQRNVVQQRLMTLGELACCEGLHSQASLPSVRPDDG